MKGTIFYRADWGRFGVRWWHGGKDYKIYRYKGEYIYDRRIAEKLLATMQADQESGFFRIEKFTEQSTDVIPFLRDWLHTQVHLSPATAKDYENSIENHLAPWFKANPVMLHEVQYDVLCRLLAEIKRVGKGRQNVMGCLHAALIYAHKAGKILTVPPFPEKRLYQIEPTVIEAIPEARQIAIIQAIPEEHQPIFWWLKYHYRRPSEAMALYKEDYDKEKDCFIIRRSFSNKKLVQHTKTHRIHVVPMHNDFVEWHRKKGVSLGPFYFTHQSSRLPGKRYQHDYLVDLLNRAAAKCGETIRLYAGLKHSSCTAAINEQGMSVDELQMLTDHARRDSVLKYADVRLEAKRRIMGKVIEIKKERKVE